MVLAFHDITDLMQALRVKDGFVALVSHELRTPLTSIMGYLELMEELADDLPPEVFDRLLSNALKNNLQGGTVAVTLARRGSGAHRCVSDTGIGISEVDQAPLFSKFFRARTVSVRDPGVGLGPVISKVIVEAHGGDITVTSHEGPGTSVHVTLPGRADAIGPAIGQPAGAGDRQRRLSEGGPTVVTRPLTQRRQP